MSDQVQDKANHNTHLWQAQSFDRSPVLGAIKTASARTGVDFAYLLNNASQESSLDPSAKATSSSATGLFQFINQTWLQMVKNHGSDYGLEKESGAISITNGRAQVDDPALRKKILDMRYDPVLSAAMAAEFTAGNKDYLARKLGGNIGSTELYLAHFLGAGGAARFIEAMRADPSASASALLPEAAKANPSVFHDRSGRARSLEDVYNSFAAKFDKNGNVFARAAVAEGKSGNKIAAMVDSAASSPATGGGPASSSWPRRDLAGLSSYFTRPPDEAASIAASPGAIPGFNWHPAHATSGTLFNAMILAQTKITEAMKGSA